MAKAHGLPVRQQPRRALAHGLQEVGVGVAGQCLGRAAFGVVAVDHVVGQLAQRRHLVARRKVLEVAKAYEAGRHARHHGGGLDLFAANGGGRSGHAQRARGGNAQGVHGLAAQELADGRAQHGAPVAHARVGRAARALELNLVARGSFAQQDGTAVAKLAGPDTELVAAVDAGQRMAAGQHGIAGERLQGLIGGQPLRVQAQQLGSAGAGGDPVRLG